MMRHRLLLPLLLLLPSPLLADAPRALPAGEKPNDHRLEPLKDLNGYFPFDVPDSPEAWAARREDVKRQVLLAAGLWPMPPRPPIEAVVYGPVKRDGYTVYKVNFESLPGLFVTGNLYKPTSGDGPFPAVLSPHGHARNGRFNKKNDAELKKALESGAELFPVGGRHPQQARCVHLARMGCIVFHYDMLGYADSVPITYEVAHRFAEQRPKLSQPGHWGLFSAQSELRLVNAFGLQTWNSLRAFDWIASRDDVDADRIGVTGASGGGTQTFFLAALEPRIAAAFPAVMVSTAMQGGCTCENASYLRIGTGNVEIAGLIAPRPLGMSAANDWTVELETKGLPELKQLYAMLGAPGNVEGRYFDFPHNFNAVSRAMMYRFFNQHLNLDGPLEEKDYVPLSTAELSVWNDEHPQPASDTAAEIALMQTIDHRLDNWFASIKPDDKESLANYREIVGGAVDVMIGGNENTAGNVEFELSHKDKIARDSWTRAVGLLRNTTYNEELPVIIWTPNKPSRGTVIWPHVNGKAAFVADDGSPIKPVNRLLTHGYRVITADLLGQGEFTDDGKSWSQSRKVDNPREFAGYTLGYNHPLVAKRVHDILSLIVFANASLDDGQPLALIGIDEAAAWATLAAIQAPESIDRVALIANGFRFGDITKIRDPNLLPGAIKYGDLPGFLALLAPRPLFLADKAAGEFVNSAYQASGNPAALKIVPAGDKARSRAVDWLLE